ncbi:hypothetical protein ACJX0J_005506 [Zea mays]
MIIWQVPEPIIWMQSLDSNIPNRVFVLLLGACLFQACYLLNTKYYKHLACLGEGDLRELRGLKYLSIQYPLAPKQAISAFGFAWRKIKTTTIDPKNCDQEEALGGLAGVWAPAQSTLMDKLDNCQSQSSSVHWLPKLGGFEHFEDLMFIFHLLMGSSEIVISQDPHNMQALDNVLLSLGPHVLVI